MNKQIELLKLLQQRDVMLWNCASVRSRTSQTARRTSRTEVEALDKTNR